MTSLTPLTEFERSLIKKVASATFPAGIASKRFVRDLYAGHIKQLSDKGRGFLAKIAHRFRRQYVLTPEERQWISEWQPTVKF